MALTEQEAKDKIASLALAFHVQTGADMDDIKWFVKRVLETSLEFSQQIIREELKKIMKS